jgi:hypothetical protein
MIAKTLLPELVHIVTPASARIATEKSEIAPP